jgi:hypothetical protein
VSETQGSLIAIMLLPTDRYILLFGFKVLDKRSAIVVGPTANVLNAVAAETNRGCPAPAPAATVSS